MKDTVKVFADQRLKDALIRAADIAERFARGMMNIPDDYPSAAIDMLKAEIMKAGE